MSSIRTFSVGDVFTSKDGPFKILEFNAHNDVKIQFLNTKSIKHVTSTAVRSKMIKDRYVPVLYKVGYLGEGKFNNKHRFFKKLKTLWSGIIRRCYDNNNVRKQYIDCIVDKRWHNFQNFCEDIIKMPNWNTPGFELDKDLMILGNKKYGPKTCWFIPHDLNFYVGKILVAKGWRVTSKGTIYSQYQIKGKSNWKKFNSIHEARTHYIKITVKRLKEMLNCYNLILHSNIKKSIKIIISRLRAEIM